MRNASLTDGVDGVLHAASLGVRAIGQGVAVAQGLAPRHVLKPVDRVLSTPKLSMEQVCGCWVPFVVGERRAIFVNFDWTECEDADQGTVGRGMQTAHGRSTPLRWKTVTRSQLKEQRNDHEDDRGVGFASVGPKHVRVPVVADRGFADSKRYGFLTEEWGFDSIRPATPGVRRPGIISAPPWSSPSVAISSSILGTASMFISWMDASWAGSIRLPATPAVWQGTPPIVTGHARFCGVGGAVNVMCGRGGTAPG